MGLSRTRIAIIGLVGASVLALGLGLGLGLKDDELPSPLENEYLVRNTAYGPVRGLVYDKENELSYNQIGMLDQNSTHDAAIFLGIPYAAPPIGQNRWKSPKDPEKWTEVREPINPDSCAQSLGSKVSRPKLAIILFCFHDIKFVFEVKYLVVNFFKTSTERCHEPCPKISEDCLYLNVYAPAKHLEEASGKKLPVLLWYHGGAFAWGAGSSFLYDG